MSNYPDGRRTLIGCNVRPGTRPGGFTNSYGDQKARARRAATLGHGHEAIKQAADAFLQKRNMHNRPSSFERAAMVYPRPSVVE